MDDLGIIQFSSILVVGGRIVGILIGFGKMSLSRGKNALPSRYLQFEGYSQRCKKLERTFISAFNLQHEITSIQDCV